MNKLSKYFIVLFSIFSLVIASSPFVSASSSDFVDLFDLSTVVFGSESIMNYSVNKSSNSINVAVENNGFSGYQDLSFYFDFGYTVATPDNPLSFSFNLRHGDDQMGFLNTSWDGFGLYGVYKGESYRCGTATVIDDSLRVSVDLTSEINYEYYLLSIYCYLNPCDIYYFNFEDCEFEYYSKIIANQDKNTDKILGAGSDVAQPDFDSTNGQIDDTVGQIESIEGAYKIDAAETQNALDKGNSFLQGSDMHRASIQVKNWIEKFVSDSPMMNGFFIAAMVLGLCFWVIGRKAGT